MGASEVSIPGRLHNPRTNLLHAIPYVHCGRAHGLRCRCLISTKSLKCLRCAVVAQTLRTEWDEESPCLSFHLSVVIAAPVAGC